MAQQDLAAAFRALHVPGSPLILFNIWDPGSAQAVAGTGAKAIASGSHGVANAFGYEDGELIPLELAIDNARRIVAATDLPVTMDIETGYGSTPDEITASTSKLLASGIVGVNLEDQIIGTTDIRPIDEQVARIKAVRAAADAAGVHLFINARTSTLLFKDATEHELALPEIIDRAKAYAEAGADGFFAPGLADIALIAQLCEASPIPVNIIRLPGMAATNTDLATAGVARISYGPFPYLDMIEWLKEQSRTVYT